MAHNLPVSSSSCLTVGIQVLEILQKEDGIVSLLVASQALVPYHSVLCLHTRLPGVYSSHLGREGLVSPILDIQITYLYCLRRACDLVGQSNGLDRLCLSF